VTRVQTWLLLGGLLTLLGLLLLSMTTGAGHYGGRDLLGYLAGDPQLRADDKLAMILHTLRGPRTLCALLVGGSLAIAASLLQNATRNPLAEPGLLGVNAGAVLGLVLGLTYAGIGSTLGYLLWSGAGALVGNLLVLGLGGLFSMGRPLQLILVGVALNAIFGGLSSFLLLSHQVVLDQFRFWDLGTVAGADAAAIRLVTPLVLLACLLAWSLCRGLTLLQMGDAQAQALGIHPRRLRLGVLLASTLLTASAVSLAGPIGFLGFLAAYGARQIEPVVLGRQLLFSALGGGLLLLLADILARWLIRPFELADGTLLALLGAPLLIALVWRGQHRLMTGESTP